MYTSQQFLKFSYNYLSLNGSRFQVNLPSIHTFSSNQISFSSLIQICFLYIYLCIPRQYFLPPWIQVFFTSFHLSIYNSFPWDLHIHIYTYFSSIYLSIQSSILSLFGSRYSSIPSSKVCPYVCLSVCMYVSQSVYIFIPGKYILPPEIPVYFSGSGR
jgi:hypothetical protein